MTSSRLADDRHTVYRFYSADEKLLYVGATSKGTDRLKSHYYGTGWWDEVAYAYFEHFPTKATALERERALIEECQPAHNKVYRFDEPAHSRPVDPNAPRIRRAA